MIQLGWSPQIRPRRRPLPGVSRALEGARSVKNDRRSLNQFSDENLHYVIGFARSSSPWRYLCGRRGDLRNLRSARSGSSGLPCREPGAPIYGTQTVVLEHLNEDHKPSPAEYSERLRERADAYGLVRRDGLAFFYPERGTAVVNMTHVQTPLHPVQASEKALEGKEQADRVVDFLKAEFPAAAKLFSGARGIDRDITKSRQVASAFRWPIVTTLFLEILCGSRCLLRPRHLA